MKENDYELTSLMLFIASSISKTIATFATYPILTIRVRLQAASKLDGNENH